MGTDIHLKADNNKEILTPGYFSDEILDAFHKHNLSRTFCNFLCRQYVISGQPELDQIGEITTTDISLFYKMEAEFVDLETILNTVNSLIAKLQSVENLTEQLDDNGEDTLGNDFYFSDFNVDKGEGYIGNNFGQDLRNFKRYLEYAKTKGTKEVMFEYM
jgi:hypothetical protein